MEGVTIPFLASATWYSALLQSLCSNTGSHSDAIAQCNPGTPRRAYARTEIIATDGRHLTLSIPVEGGASHLKKARDISLLRLSDHGNWRHTHLGAIEASYGRTPFFIHLMPAIREVYSTPAVTLAEFNATIHKAVFSFLLQDIPPRQAWQSAQKPQYSQWASEISAGISPTVSMLDALMRLGPDTLFGLASIIKMQR